MLISDHWLRQMCDPKLAPEEVAQRLTLAGLEVAACEQSPAIPSQDLVVAEIVTVSPIDESEHLRSCKVDAGPLGIFSVVCGAPNVREGAKAIYVPSGTRLASGKSIETAKIAGNVSEGMLCSAAEANLGESADQLLLVDDAFKPGTPLSEIVDLPDTIYDIELTPNRGDCLSVLGIARELHALTEAPLHAPEIAEMPIGNGEIPACRVAIEAKDDCLWYAGQVISDLDPRAVTPLWMRERLRRCGIKPTFPVVDVLNYVMLELGQPMHAFDLKSLEGNIAVRRASPGERLTLLDGRQVMLDQNYLIIADSRKALGLAGVMGGLDSAVKSETTAVFLESAHFVPWAIAGRARTLGLTTEAAHRFERGVDPNLPPRALRRAAQLISELLGGKPSQVVQASGSKPDGPKAIAYHPSTLTKLTGLSLSAEKQASILSRLGMDVTQGRSELAVLAPAYRYDLKLPADLVEEIIRVHGFDRIPLEAPRRRVMAPHPNRGRERLERIRQNLIARGYSEAVTYSFVDEELDKACAFNADQPLALANPIADRQRVMRRTIWPGLLEALQFNVDRQVNRIKMFEVGHVYARRERTIVEDRHIAGAISGSRFPEQWAVDDVPMDFFDLKGDMDALLRIAGVTKEVGFASAAHPALAPGQSASVHFANTPIGWIGRLHPLFQKRLGIQSAVWVFELDWDALPETPIPKAREVSRFPLVRRDLSLLVTEEMPVIRLQEAAANAGGKWLKEIKIFDIYRGSGIPFESKSVGMGLIFSSPLRTLTDEEVDETMRKIIRSLEQEFNASVRH